MRAKRTRPEGTRSQSEFTLILVHFQSVELHENLDINGDGRVERHEIKKMVQLSQPEILKGREAYLNEVAKFRDMIRDCDTNPENGQITFEEGIACLKQYVSSVKTRFSEKT